MTFEKKYLKSGPNQISFVTNDLDRALDIFRTTFGIPRFFTMKRMELKNQQFQTQSAPMVINVAIVWTGTLFLQIIQPLTADAISGHNLQKEREREDHLAGRFRQIRRCGGAVKFDTGQSYACAAPVEVMKDNPKTVPPAHKGSHHFSK